MAPRHSLIVVGLLALMISPSFAVATPVDAKKIEALIARLVSPNPEPDDRFGGVDKYPPGYDDTAQKRVWIAFRELFDIGLDAFPYLLDHFSDERYCLTADTGPGDYNWSVGKICRAIVECHLYPFAHAWKTATHGKGDPRGRPRRPSYIRHYRLNEPKSAKAWWDERKGYSLRDLQIETLEWIIAEEAKRPADYTDEERKYLHEYLMKLRAADKPAPPSWPFAK